MRRLPATAHLAVLLLVLLAAGCTAGQEQPDGDMAPSPGTPGPSAVASAGSSPDLAATPPAPETGASPEPGSPPGHGLPHGHTKPGGMHPRPPATPPNLPGAIDSAKVPPTEDDDALRALNTLHRFARTDVRPLLPEASWQDVLSSYRYIIRDVSAGRLAGPQLAEEISRYARLVERKSRAVGLL
jgi:hypothetical protein